MKLLDVNIWLVLVLSGHTHHEAARIWFDGETKSASLCFCRATQQELLRLLSTAEVLVGYGNPPLTTRLPSKTNWQVKDLTPEAWAKTQPQVDLRATA